MMTDTDLPDLLLRLRMSGARVDRCGSRVTCSPPPMDTDQDFLVELGACSPSRAVDIMTGYKLHWEGGEHYEEPINSNFASWRSEDCTINLIVTAVPAFAEKHRLATAVCKRLNLMEKADRIVLFQAILYGRAPDSAQPTMDLAGLAERGLGPAASDEPLF